MERRVLMAIFLAFLVLYAWQALFVKPAPKPVAGTVPAVTTTTPDTSTPSSAAATPAPATEPPAATLVGDVSERDVRVETQTVVAVFTNRGARLKSWQLKRYREPQHGQPQELIEHQPNQPLPFSLRTPDDK